MDMIHYIITVLIFFLMDIGSQKRCLSVIAETLEITAGQCVEYLDLQNKTNVAVLKVLETSMQYFPEGNCYSTVPDEEVRVLNLPNLKKTTIYQRCPILLA